MQDNRLVMAGVIKKTPQCHHTPVGIPVVRFTLSHQSIQQEGGMQRQAMCQIGVIATGDALYQSSQGLNAGDEVRVSGFLTRANHRDGEFRLILHAQKIERFDAITS